MCTLANEGHRGICGHVMETDDQLEFLHTHEERCRMYMCGTGTRILAERVEAFGGRAAAQNTLHADAHSMYQDMRYMIWYTNECDRKAWGRVVDVTDMCRACRNLPGNRISTAYYAEDQHGMRTGRARRGRHG